jgi:hypothetical protein
VAAEIDTEATLTKAADDSGESQQQREDEQESGRHLQTSSIMQGALPIVKLRIRLKLGFKHFIRPLQLHLLSTTPVVWNNATAYMN